MRVATLLAFIAVTTISVSAASTSGEAGGSATFSFAAGHIAQEHADAHGRRAVNRLSRRKQNRAGLLSLVPFDAWDDGTSVVPLPAVPPLPPDGVSPAVIPSAQLPACRETIDGVTIMRGRPCRT